MQFRMKAFASVLYWLPRILVILAILFLSMFALDSFSSQFTFWQNIGSFLIHLIPSFVLTGILIFAWKHEKTGGIIFTTFGLAFSIFIFIINFRRTNSLGLSLIIVLSLCIPFVLAGVLFIISHYRKKKELSGIS